MLHLTAYYSGCAVLIVLIMEVEQEEMVGRQFNGFEELEPLAQVSCVKSL